VQAVVVNSSHLWENVQPTYPYLCPLQLRCNDYVVHQTGENTYAITRAGSLATPVLDKTEFIVCLDPVSSKYICTAGCGKTVYKGKACVHIVKVFTMYYSRVGDCNTHPNTFTDPCLHNFLICADFSASWDGFISGSICQQTLASYEGLAFF
jgi:hypothetical protein